MKRSVSMKPFKGASWDGKRWNGQPPRKNRGKALPRRKASKRKDDLEYGRRRRWFLAMPENSRCPVAWAGLLPDINGDFVSHYRLANTIHHTWRRGKYFLDESTWMGMSLEGNLWVEREKEEARRRGWLCDTAETRERWLKKRG